MTNETKISQKDRQPVFRFILIYSLLLLLSITYEHALWKTVALIIGSIYVYIAAYYFHDNIFLPYKSEIANVAKTVSTKESETFDPYNKRNNVFFWMLRWMLPALSIQLFIFAGFFFISDSNKFNGSGFTHPYHYGEIYKHWLKDYSALPISSVEILANRPIGKNGNVLPPDSINPLSYIYVFKTEGLKKAFAKNCEKLILNSEQQKNSSSGNAENNQVDSQTDKDRKQCDNYIDSTIKNEPEKSQNLFLKPILKATIETEIFKIPFIIAFTFSFIGTLIYTVKEIAFRLYTKDLYPNSLVNFLIRFLTAPAVSMVIAYFWMDDWPSIVAPLTFFIIGFFPQIAMQYIQRTAEKYIGTGENGMKKHETLTQLQGMTEYLTYRFKEIGIGDAQNLAYVDLPHLGNNIGYGRRLLVDMVAQALLYVHFSESFHKLNNLGIRNIISFRSIIEESGDPSQYMTTLATNSGITVEQIKGVYNLISSGVLKDRVDTLESIAHSDESDQMLHLSKK